MSCKCGHNWCWHCKGDWPERKCKIEAAIQIMLVPVLSVMTIVVVPALGMVPFPALRKLSGGKPLVLSFLRAVFQFF